MSEERQNSPEHLAGNSDHVLHVLADQREDAHVAVDGDLEAKEERSASPQFKTDFKRLTSPTI
jgi:hypothetical protein